MATRVGRPGFLFGIAFAAAFFAAFLEVAAPLAIKASFAPEVPLKSKINQSDICRDAGFNCGSGISATQPRRRVGRRTSSQAAP